MPSSPEPKPSLEHGDVVGPQIGSNSNSNGIKHLVLVGACYMDTILTVPHYPTEDSKLRATSLHHRRGGNCPNTLEVLHQLFHLNPAAAPTPYLVSCLPDRTSPATHNILSSFGPNATTSPSINFTHSLYRPGHQDPASSYIFRSSATQSRTIVNHNDLPEMTADEFVTIVDAFADKPDGGDSWWHFEGRIPTTTLQCIRYLRQALPRCTISVEVEKANREGLDQLAAEADVVFYSRSWAESRGYAGPEACLRGEASSSAGASLMLCTWGAQGASGLFRSRVGECEWEYMHGRPNISGSDGDIVVVDTIGAGDTFIAGMLFGLVCHAHDQSQEQKLAFSTELATRKVQIDGFAGLATYAASWSWAGR